VDRMVPRLVPRQSLVALSLPRMVSLLFNKAKLQGECRHLLRPRQVLARLLRANSLSLMYVADAVLRLT